MHETFTTPMYSVLLFERMLASLHMPRLTCVDNFLLVVSAFGTDVCAKEGLLDLIAQVVPTDIPIFEKRLFEE